MKTVAGVKVFLTQDPDKAYSLIEELNICRNCIQFEREGLFDFKCKGIEDSEPFPLSSDESCCEVFEAKNKTVDYWIRKLCTMQYEGAGLADFDRELRFHQDNGTDIEFIMNRKK